jgi:outer membrane protein TolC
MLGPNFKTPQAPVAANWMERTDDSVKPTASEHRDWWTAFNDPAVTRLIEVAYQRNLTVQTAGVRVLEARARLGMAIGEFYPQQQQAGAALNYNRIPRRTG